MIRLGVTGTDTGVGKTVIAAGMTAWMREKNIKAVAMKPIETGGSTADAELIHEASGLAGTLDRVCPYRFAEPVAPLVASRKSGTTIDVSVLDSTFAALARDRDAIVIEGAGGILVPIAPDLSYATLFRHWDADVLIVAANRLGTINHTLLTVSVARSYGLQVAAIVLNNLPATDDDASRASNAATIAELLPDVPVVSFPALDHPRDISLIASHIESTGLGKLILERCARRTISGEIA